MADSHDAGERPHTPIAYGFARLKGIAFRSMESALGQTLLNARGGLLHLAGHLRTNTWRGQSEAQLVIEDAARP